MHSEHLVTTPAIPAIHHCGAVILAGVAEGLPARVDPTPLNSVGHTAAIIAGHHIYRLTKSGLVEIDVDRINSRTIHGPLLPSHQCDRIWPPEYIDHTNDNCAIANDEERIPF